jgi:hypothetical protein
VKKKLNQFPTVCRGHHNTGNLLTTEQKPLLELQKPVKSSGCTFLANVSVTNQIINGEVSSLRLSAEELETIITTVLSKTLPAIMLKVLEKFSWID